MSIVWIENFMTTDGTKYIPDNPGMCRLRSQEHIHTSHTRILRFHCRQAESNNKKWTDTYETQNKKNRKTQLWNNEVQAKLIM